MNTASSYKPYDLHKIEPTVRIGKNGLTKNQTDEIKKQLEKRKIIKIKMLKSFRRKEAGEMASKIAEKTNSEIISVVGFIIVVRKR